VKTFLKDTIYRNAYFLIGAAWLFTLSFIFSNYWSYTSSPQGVKKTLENYIQKQENSFYAFLQDTPLVKRLIRERVTESELAEVAGRKYGIFIYRQEDYGPLVLSFWNTHQFLPTDEILANPEGEYMVDLPNGQYEFINRQMNITDDDKLIVCALIPVRWKYFLENNYLQNGFVEHPNVEKNYSIAQGITAYPVNNIQGRPLFYLEQKAGGKIFSNDWITLLLRLLGSLLLLFYLHVVAISISKRYGSAWGIGFLTIVVIALRILSYFFAIPINFRQFDLFDPYIYGSNIILRSLGDLLVNALLFFWIVLFARTQIGKYKIPGSVKHVALRYVFAIAICMLLVLSTMISGHIIRSLVADSQISYDVTNFFNLNIYSLFGFIVLCCICLGYFILSQVLLQFIDQFLENSFFQKTVMVAFIGLSILTFRINTQLVNFELFLLLWLLLFVFLMSRENLTRSRYISAGNTVFWLFVFSASITSLIITENRYKELEIRKRTAEKLAMQVDPSSERLLNIAIQSIGNDFLFSNLNRLKNEYEATRVKDSLISANFSAYLNKYETSLYTYSIDQKPLTAKEAFTYDTLNTIYTIQGKLTNISGLKYYETAFDRFSYIYKKEIKDTSGSPVAYFFMLSNPRKYKSDALSPELFKQPEDFSFERSSVYAYAIYSSMELINHINDYAFAIRLDSSEIPAKEYDVRLKNGYNELWYKKGVDKVVIITKKSNFLLEAMTLFAYLFCAFLFLVGLFQLSNLVIRSGFHWYKLQELWQMNIRSQIYSTIIFVSIFSFVVIGAATILFFISRYNKNNRERLSRTIQVMSSDFKNKISDHSIMDDQLPIRDSAAYEKIQRQINEVAEIHNTDINIYNPDGTLQITSQPFVYNKGILSYMMEPSAYYNMKQLRKIQYIQDERIGNLAYQSIYVPVRKEDGDIDSYLNIPNFTTSSDLKQEISNFLVTIINLNAFIFLIASVIAVIITNRITNSFTWIGERMREINLGKHNEEITWSRNDEIGGLVREYNKMVRKLEESAAALAKTEREGAWREMARQVAHEIKNPLTPMKLSIQYLQKAIDNNAPNVKELSSTVATTLIEQIEHLSRIAAEFSQFANIGNISSEVFDLHELLHSLVLLHGIQENAEITWQPVNGKLMVHADKTQINRLFTNLLQNAIEAIPGEKMGLIQLKEEMNDGQVIVSVQDNGTGIPAETQAKIFSPNFTTKTSGTGLGLAMCKGIVEQAKGNIWFETKPGEGTSFFVSLPLEMNGVTIAEPVAGH
jgi:two-component system, NtrC family, nitrogen regulation sensor histidine kinase NtrY